MTYYDLHTHEVRPVTGQNFSICNLPCEKSFADPGIYPDTYFSAGIHPWHIASKETELLIGQLAQIASSPRILAIGECGLDKLTDTPLAVQEIIFRQQIEIAEKHEKPMIIHCVKAFNELIRLHKETTPRQAWIIHGFRGKPQLAEELLQHGIRISVGIQFNSGITTALSPTRLLLETDDSNISIEAVYGQAAGTWNITEKELGTLIEKSFRTLFRLPDNKEENTPQNF